MKASRVMLGFRRLNLVLMVPFAIAILFCVGMGCYTLATMPKPGVAVNGPDFKKWFIYEEGTSREEISADLTKRYGYTVPVDYSGNAGTAYPVSTQMWARSDANADFFRAAQFALGAVLTFLLVWIAGWIVRGFVSDQN